MKRAAPTSDHVVPPKKPTLENVQTTQSVLCFDKKDVPEHKQTDDSLNSKIDSLIGEFKELKFRLTSTAKAKETCQKPLAPVMQSVLQKLLSSYFIGLR